MHQKNQSPLTYAQALQKAEAFCAYQERSQYEVRGKLLDLGLRGDDLERIISELISTNFLNEERFALAYAQGKMRMKSWGRRKIADGLRFKQVSAPLIKKALNSLNGDEYEEKLRQLIEKKGLSMNEKNTTLLNYKLGNYAISKGYEPDLVFYILKTKEL